MQQNNTQHLTANVLYLTAFSEYLILKGHTIKTRQSILKTITRLSQWTEKENIELNTITYNELLGYVSHCKKQGHKQRTIQVTIGQLKHYYNFLMSEKEITDNPCTNIHIQGIKRKTLYELFTPEELESFYKQYQPTNTITRQRDKIILGLIIYQALRSTEIENLTPQDIKTREGKIHIQGSRKSNERTLKLETFQVFDLMDYINETRKQILTIKGKNSKQLFISTGSSEQLGNTLQKLAKELQAQNSKIKDIKQLRASVITNWLKVYNTRKVQVMAGHRYISSTEAYKENNMDVLKDDINKYHPIA
jgi:site-specific recombinase XerD